MLTGKMTRRRSNARNAYDLMTDIKEYILEEPKRVYMPKWIITSEEIEDLLAVEGPACGTVGCIAGNTVVLTGDRGGRSTAGLALDILGGSNFNLQTELNYLFLDTDVDATRTTAPRNTPASSRGGLVSFNERIRMSCEPWK